MNITAAAVVRALGFNRTFMELKSAHRYGELHAGEVLIVPLWN